MLKHTKLRKKKRGIEINKNKIRLVEMSRKREKKISFELINFNSWKERKLISSFVYILLIGHPQRERKKETQFNNELGKKKKTFACVRV